MPMEALKTTVGITKVLSLILGAVTLVMAMISHFESSWFKLRVDDPTNPEATMRLYDMCKYNKDEDIKCPLIAMENFYLSIVTIAFIISLISMVFSIKIVTNVKSKAMRTNDVGFHLVFAILLAVSGVFFILSANQIKDLLGDDDKYSEVTMKEIKFYRTEKIVAAGLGFAQAAIYCIIVILYQIS